MAPVLQSAKTQQDVISNLANAAKISPLVQERTIGPKNTINGTLSLIEHKNNSHQDRHTSKINQNNNNSSNNVTPGNYKFRKDVWREVNIEAEQEEKPKNLLHLNDFKAIRFRLALNNAEKQRRAKISTDLQAKQFQMDTEIEQRLHQIRIDSAEKLKRINDALNQIEKNETLKVQKVIGAQGGHELTNSLTGTPRTAEVSVTDGITHRQTVSASVPWSNNVGTEERIKHYYELMNYYEEYKTRIQPLLSDVDMKKFRFNCQKGVNTPVNTVAAVSVQHFQGKFEKISDLLSGNPVRIGDVQFSASEHPLGVRYCTLLLAKQFITQGTTVTSSHATAAFAAIIVSIWQLFPDFGKLFVAVLYTECPFLVPYFIPQKPGQSENEYFSVLGFKFNDNKIEEHEQYLKRIAGLQRLYSAVLITKLRRSQQHADHPHGLENGWIWLSNFLMLDPLPGVSPTLLLEFIQICGSEMWQTYKQQFIKLITVLHGQYMPKLNQVDSGCLYSRLKDLVSTIVKENMVTPPIGTLPPNFW